MSIIEILGGMSFLAGLVTLVALGGRKRRKREDDEHDALLGVVSPPTVEDRN